MSDNLQFDKDMKNLSRLMLFCVFILLPFNIIYLVVDANNASNSNATTPIAHVVEYNDETESVIEEETVTFPSELYSEQEIYELAKIIMAEAEGQSQTCKEYIGQIIMNRVNSTRFPDTIHDVIFDGIQFTPTFNGRWERVEPNHECYDAAYAVLNASKPLLDEGAMWFEAFHEESDIEDSWHYNNLEIVAEEDGVRFYKEKNK